MLQDLLGVIAIDGTKVHANASQHANRDYERLARWGHLMAAIDCCTREIVGWPLELRCCGQWSIALVEDAVAARGDRPGTVTLGTDNGSAFTARAFKLVLSGLGVAHRRGG